MYFQEHDQRFAYDFDRYYHLTYRQLNQDTGRSQVLNFRQAAGQAMEGHAYIYQEKDIFIPFWKTDRASIQLNSNRYNLWWYQ